MRRLPVLVLLAAASGALAGPSAQPATWAEWVGDWQGKLKWSSCSAEGDERASLALDAVDGAVALDLAPAGAALASMQLVEDNGGWIGQQGDVTVRVRHAKPETLELAVDLDSGCQVRATLTRDSVG